MTFFRVELLLVVGVLASGAPAIGAETEATVPASPPATESPPLPDEVDLRPRLEELGFRPLRQGERGTCSVFTTAAALEFAIARRQGQPTPISVEYLNWASNQITNDPVDGSFFSHVLEGFDRYGACAEADMPYRNEFDPALAPTAEVQERARTLQQLGRDGLKVHWINPWKRRPGLRASHLDEIRKVLAQGWPVAAGSSHSRLLVGYRNDPAQPGGGVFLTKDSGLGDYGEITYEFARSKVGDVFWVEALPEASPQKDGGETPAPASTTPAPPAK